MMLVLAMERHATNMLGGWPFAPLPRGDTVFTLSRHPIGNQSLSCDLSDVFLHTPHIDGPPTHPQPIAMQPDGPLTLIVVHVMAFPHIVLI